MKQNRKFQISDLIINQAKNHFLVLSKTNNYVVTEQQFHHHVSS